MSACHEYEELVDAPRHGGAGAGGRGPGARAPGVLRRLPREAESSVRLLAEVALPPPSPAMQERMEALPQRALGGVAAGAGAQGAPRPDGGRAAGRGGAVLRGGEPVA